jgi:hypothetical protein
MENLRSAGTTVDVFESRLGRWLKPVSDAFRESLSNGSFLMLHRFLIVRPFIVRVV